MSKSYDAIIVGAGPAGSATAYYLAQQGFDVLLLDRFDFPRDKTCGDALTPRALAILDHMGLLDRLQEVGYQTNATTIYAPNGQSIISPFPTVGNNLNYTLIVPRLVLDHIIYERALASGATFCRVRVKAVAREGAGVVVRGESEGQTASFKARLR